jgi:uncharacterized protein (TIGR02246 family)
MSHIARSWFAYLGGPPVSRLLVIAVLVAGAIGTPRAQVGLPREAEIYDLVRRYVEAREARDPKAIEALFTPDADQLVSSGEWRRGRDAVVKGTLASSAATGGSRSITVEKVRMLGADIAIADGRYEISGLSGGETRRMWTTFVAVSQNGTWRISAIRNMLPAP